MNKKIKLSKEGQHEKKALILAKLAKKHPFSFNCAIPEYFPPAKRLNFTDETKLLNIEEKLSIFCNGENNISFAPEIPFLGGVKVLHYVTVGDKHIAAPGLKDFYDKYAVNSAYLMVSTSVEATFQLSLGKRTKEEYKLNEISNFSQTGKLFIYRFRPTEFASISEEIAAVGLKVFLSNAQMDIRIGITYEGTKPSAHASFSNQLNFRHELSLESFSPHKEMVKVILERETCRKMNTPFYDILEQFDLYDNEIEQFQDIYNASTFFPKKTILLAGNNYTSGVCGRFNEVLVSSEAKGNGEDGNTAPKTSANPDQTA